VEMDAWRSIVPELKRLTEDLSAWAAVVLIPKSEEALRCAAHYGLPADWGQSDNRLDSGSMNARAFLTQQEVVDNAGEVTAPPGEHEVSQHVITASAVVIVPNVGTLEVLANTSGYHFGDEQLQRMRECAQQVAAASR
jgi:hypothetical protein